MDIEMNPRITLWFDGEHYGYVIDLEGDSDDPLDDLIEGYKPTLNEAIATITCVIERRLCQKVERC